ncbi:S1 family peptidase [Salsipaludibacter albus]|uniref:S1 family peptidase n=1 Tax=Salsipaludibacter albus TaxID=2849650 RepID=UPI001EE3E2C0|nr:S1 family peptidase [Salsipaludibacter albus]MBY5163084.1 S1 family peptidase [Salsipaludibacter albus]
MHRTLVIRTAAVLAATALVAGATAAAAQEDPAVDDKVLDRTTSEALDARLVAEANDWKPVPTREFLVDSRRFAELAASIAESHPDRFAAAVYAERPGDTSLLRFEGHVPKEVEQLVERSGLRVKLTDDARHTAEELQERTAKVHDLLVESGYEQVVAAAMPDDTIQASVYGKGSPKLPDELAKGVELTVSERPVARDEHTRGGAWLLNNEVNWCTTGFSVRSTTGTTGISTAGHCTPEVDEYVQPSDGLEYDIDHEADHYGLFGDVAWYTTDHVEPAEFYATATQVREVNSVSNLLPVNVPSCVYGRSSNDRECDDVYSNFVIATFGATHWFLMAMDSDNTIGGDSGGPWSFGTEADGIHKGDLTLGGGRRNVWTRASLMPISLGVSVRTQ